MQIRQNSYCLFAAFLLLFSCQNQIEDPFLDEETNVYLHISHTRTNTNPDMIPEVESKDFSRYDMIWLGGDMAYLTSKDEETMNRVDSVFDLANPNTLWALGNHDYSDLKRIETYTQRPAYYSYHRDGITYLILDTQASLSRINGPQQELFNAVVDTIQKSSHLVILHHKLIWMSGNEELETQIDSVANGGLGGCFYCINPNNFWTDLYPKLEKVKNKGIEVICIGGDIGAKNNEFEYITPEGIHLLASGASSKGKLENKALVFIHDLAKKELRWEYRLILDL